MTETLRCPWGDTTDMPMRGYHDNVWGKGFSHLVLDVLSDNTRAVNFYQAHGYQKVADRHIRLGKNEYPLTVFRKANPLIMGKEKEKSQ